jgi:hypothetical protein
VAPNWPKGIVPGVGPAGADAGARLQVGLPDALARRLAGILVTAVGAVFLGSGLG